MFTKIFFRLLLISITLFLPVILTADHVPVETPVYQFRGDLNYPPYEYVDENGEISGFNVAILKAVSQAAGLKINIVLEPWQQVRHQLKNGEIDGVTGLYFSEQREKFVDFSLPFHVVSHAIFITTDSEIKSFKDIFDKTIIVQEGDIMHDFVLENRIGRQIIAVDNQQVALHLLATGKYDCALLVHLQGLYNLEKLQLNTVKTVGLAIEPREYCIAVTKGHIDLLRQLNEGLGIIKQNGTYDKIYKQWFGIYEKHDFAKKVRYYIYALIMVFFLLLLGLLWSLSLRSQVSGRTRAMAENEALYRNLIYHSSDAIYLLFKGKLEIYNDRFLTLFQLTPEDMASENFHALNLVSEADQQQMVQREAATQLGESLPPHYTIKCHTFTGREIEVEISETAIPYKGEMAAQGIVRDITERRHMELQMQQMQKMEAIGTLAGGIAHDFNNLLTVIIGHGQLSQINLPPDRSEADDIKAILAAAQRAQELTSKLLAFSRQQIHHPKIIDLNSTIVALEKILRRMISEDIEMRLDLTPQLPQIKADPGQIEQILMNLVINARDAINENPQEHKRHITIKTDNIRFDENYIQLNPETAPGQHVYFSVTDTGVGISKEIVSKIFDPFFTTKDIGKGTGLGLATVYGIAKQNKGTVLVSSKLKKGTTISICWPATDEVAVTAQPTSPQVHTGVETILLVEDNYEVRNFVRTALSSLGFTIFEAENGKQALEIMRQHHREINLIFTDVIMPEMNGRELAVTVQKKYTGTPILFTSGHADDLIDTTAEFVNQHNFLHKPYSIATLSQKIRNSLDTKKTL